MDESERRTVVYGEQEIGSMKGKLRDIQLLQKERSGGEKEGKGGREMKKGDNRKRLACRTLVPMFDIGEETIN